MPQLRATFRLGLLFLTALLVPVCLLIVGVASIFGPRARWKVVLAATPIVCRIYLACFGVRLRTAGDRDSHARIFVANHISYLDIFVAGTAVAGVFVSRHDVKRWPIVGWLANIGGTVFIDRSSIRSAVESSSAIVERAAAGARVLLFPEGGILPGPGVKSFKPFLLAAVASEGLPVQPIAIRYTGVRGGPDGASAPDVVRWDDQPLTTHVWDVLKLTGIDAVVTFLPSRTAEAPAGSAEARRFAEVLRSEIERSATA